MEKVRLGDIFEYLPKSKLKAGDGKKTGKYKFFTSSNIQDKYVDEFIYDGEYLIFGTGGNASINYCNEKFSTSTDNFVVKVNGNFNTKLIYLYFKNDMSKLEKGFKGASIKHISKEYINQLYIPKYDLEAQEDIVKKLNRVQEIIDIRKKQIEELDELIKSQFVEMFGEPTINQKGFPLEKVEDVIDFQGGSQPDKRYFEYVKTEDNIRLIQIRDYKTDDFITYIPKKLAKRFCEEDDIMIGRYGPPIFQILQGIKGSYNVALMKAIPKKGNKEFIRYFLKQECLLHYLEGMSQRTAGQAGIEMPKLKKYPFPYPPIELQNRFADIVKQIDKHKFEIQKSLEEMQKLQESLMNKYFGG